jgi:hypothetical protein
MHYKTDKMVKKILDFSPHSPDDVVKWRMFTIMDFKMDCFGSLDYSYKK